MRKSTLTINGKTISPGSLIKVKMNLSAVPISAAARGWYYAIHMHDTAFYVLHRGCLMYIVEASLIRADLDNRLEVF